MDSLLIPIDDFNDSPSNSELTFFTTFISVLEGIKTRIKNLHWASEKLNIRDKRGAHLYLDEFLDAVIDYQDKLAESCQGILGSMSTTAISGTPFVADNPAELMTYCKEKTLNFYNNLPSSTVYAGIKSETEVLILNINKYTFLFRLTE